MPAPAIGTPMALAAPRAGLFASSSCGRSRQPAAQTVSFPVMINNPYHPSWTVGGSH
jgi:hypothetical protein